jgi:hypothetical protein
MKLLVLARANKSKPSLTLWDMAAQLDHTSPPLSGSVGYATVRNWW